MDHHHYDPDASLAFLLASEALDEAGQSSIAHEPGELDHTQGAGRGIRADDEELLLARTPSLVKLGDDVAVQPQRLAATQWSEPAIIFATAVVSPLTVMTSADSSPSVTSSVKTAVLEKNGSSTH